ncbi:MAG: mechanosensitive ion channel family protein [Steroidobacteraceae bacterium]
MSELLDQVWFDNSVRTWLTAAAASLFTFTVLPLARRFVLGQQRRLAGRETPAGVDLALLLIARTRPLFLWIVALWVAERFLALPPGVERISKTIIVLSVWLQAALWGTAAVRFALDQQEAKAAAAGDQRFRGSLGVVLFVARLGIFAVATLLALDNLGVNITALVAGLGVGGIAIALAVQTILGDLLASLSITLDKPFTVGDTLRVDDIEGSVERIGVKSTRLRSLSGEEVIIANADLLRSRVRNLGRMPERRSLFTVGVAYETPREKLDAVPALVEAAVRGVADTRFEYCVFRSFGDSALNFEICYYVTDPRGGRYLAAIDAVNRAIHAAFGQQGIEFAYPTRTVIVKR